MAKEEKEKNGGSKGIVRVVGVILAIVLIIVLLASFVFAIFEAIIDFIKNIVLNIVNGLLNFLAHPIKSTIQALGGFDNFLQGSLNRRI